MYNLIRLIEKPTLVLNAFTVHENIRAMAERARRWGVAFRPHFKTHQSAEIGNWFKDEGVRSITVSSLEMAEYFTQHGWDDITIAFPFNPRQMLGYDQLARRVRLGVVIESAEVVTLLDERATAAMDVWIKIDVGSRRTGIAVDDVEQVCTLAQRAMASKKLILRGLLTHAGNTYRQNSREAVAEVNQSSISGLNRIREALHSRGAKGLLISIGDTPACTLCDPIGEVDEIRPGNFVLYDAMQLAHGVCRFDQVAVALACPVVAKHPQRGEIVIHGGAVHLSSEFYEADGRRIYGLVCPPRDDGWGEPLPGTTVSRLSQEHGIVTAGSQAMAQISVGDLVFVLPAHSCITIACMRRYLTTGGEWIEAAGSQPWVTL